MPRRRLPWPSFLSATEPCHSTTIDLDLPFADADVMGVIWHGNYLRYCERGREELGRVIGYSSQRMRELGCFAPIIRSQLLHHRSARPGETLRIAVGLYPTAQPRLYHRYSLSVDDHMVVEAETEQVLTDTDFTLMLQQPDELAALLRTTP